MKRRDFIAACLAAAVAPKVSTMFGDVAATSGFKSITIAKTS